MRAFSSKATLLVFVSVCLHLRLSVWLSVMIGMFNFYYKPFNIHSVVKKIHRIRQRKITCRSVKVYWTGCDEQNIIDTLLLCAISQIIWIYIYPFLFFPLCKVRKKILGYLCVSSIFLLLCVYISSISEYPNTNYLRNCPCLNM